MWSCAIHLTCSYNLLSVGDVFVQNGSKSEIDLVNRHGDCNKEGAHAQLEGSTGIYS